MVGIRRIAVVSLIAGFFQHACQRIYGMLAGQGLGGKSGLPGLRVQTFGEALPAPPKPGDRGESPEAILQRVKFGV